MTLEAAALTLRSGGGGHVVGPGARWAASNDNPSVELQLELILDVIEAASRLEGDTDAALVGCGTADVPRGRAGRKAGTLIIQYYRLQQRLQDLPLDHHRSGIAAEVDDQLFLRVARLRTALQLAFTSNPSDITEKDRLAIRGLGDATGRLLELRARVEAQLLAARDDASPPVFPGLTSLLKASPLAPRRRGSVIMATLAGVLLPVGAVVAIAASGSPSHPATITWINDTGMDLYVHPCAYRTCDETDQRTPWVKAPNLPQPVSHTWADVAQPARFAVSTSAQGRGPLRCLPARVSPGPTLHLATAQPCG